MERAVVGLKWTQNEGLKKPADVSAMPFRGADVGHGLHRLVLGAQGSGQSFGDGAHSGVGGGQIRWRGAPAVFRHQIIPFAARTTGDRVPITLQR